MYRPGYLNIEDFIKVLSLILNKTDLDKVETIILGDFNVDYSAKQNSLSRRMDEFPFLFNLTQIISKPTNVTETSKSIIDLILVNNNLKIVQCDVLNLSISGLHNVIYCVVKETTAKGLWISFFQNYEKKAFLNDIQIFYGA